MQNLIEQQLQRVMRLAQTAEARANTIPPLRLLLQTLRAYSEDRGSLIAAALSYYALLSIFPLMLFLMTLLGEFVETDRAIRSVSSFITANLPFSTALLQNSLLEVSRLRGALTIAAAASFLWSASGVFDLIQLGINRAFRVNSPRPMWRQRLVSMGMVLGTSLLFGLSFGLTTALRLAIHYRLLQRHTFFTDALPTAGALVLSGLVFGMLYRYIPYDPVIRWRDVWLSAALAAVLWEIAKLIFAWYITNYALLNMVYGSVGTVIAIMLWGYVTAAILLIGAELAAVRTGARQREKTGKEWWALVSP
ncbi:MAG: YihY/virulence factor BrkB family protein [Chloroflexota bacterium]|nr:YihY/virulence factor BrkB family protein [Chloroflexota bacterium]